MEEWKIYRLGDLVDFQNGYAFKSSKFLYDGKYKIIRIKELKNGLVKFFEDTVSISDEPNEILSKILVNKGDVIFALTGDPVSKQNANSWVGRVSLYTHDIPAYLNQRTCKIIQCNNVVPQYVYYYFRQYENLYSLASKATGSASQANISTKILEDTEILLPSLSVQKKMVAILASLDNKIALNRRINDKCTNSGIRTGRHHESSIHHQDRSDKPHHQGETHIIEPNYQNYVFDTIYRPRSPLRCVSE